MEIGIARLQTTHALETGLAILQFLGSVRVRLSVIKLNPGADQTSPVTTRPGVYHIPGSFHHCSTILSILGPNYALTVLFLGTHTRTSQWVTHHGIALARYSLNIGVLMEPEASELLEGLMLGRDENIHLKITPLDDVRSYKFSPS
ncbi:hypothetical protein DVH24_009448 [Malus domestica]|uniref:Uncharacterized protein n=1 Tax=Malus domestica TaxID=3750 RepID=A0A498IU22_MALDO|nr:hypothetical protein DVH24_009448 [Malus domestica]